MNSNEQFDRLLVAYRASHPDPDPSADFMPGLWRRIESRNQFTFRLRRWSQAVLATTALACAAMFALLVSQGAAGSRSYIEALADDPSPENVVMSEASFQETAFINDGDAGAERSLESFSQ
jgi:anti-sigma-K factor RskA